MTPWNTGLHKSSELREMRVMLSYWNVLKLPMLCPASQPTNGILKHRTLFCVGPKVLFSCTTSRGDGCLWAERQTLFFPVARGLEADYSAPPCVSGVERNHPP